MTMPVPTYVHLSEYDPHWQIQFVEERAYLSDLFGAHAVAIEHIGSTSVPHLAAKPTVDIAVAVRTLDVLTLVIPHLEANDYEYLGEYGLPNRHFLRKPIVEEDGKPSFHLHIALEDSDHMTAWLVFRDILCRDLRIRQEYEALKRELAARYPNDRPSYTAAKGAFITAHVEAALRSGVQ